MNLMFLMIVVAILSFGVVGGLFVLMKNDSAPEEEAVPITDINEIKKEVGAYSHQSKESSSESQFDRDGFDTHKPLHGVEKEVHDIVESNRTIVDVPLEKLMKDFEGGFEADEVEKGVVTSARDNDAISKAVETKESSFSDDVYVGKIEALQNEKEMLQKRLNSLIDEKSLMETRFKEAEVLTQEKLDQSEENITRLKEEIEHLKENFTKDDVTETDMIRQGYEEQIVQLNDSIETLREEVKQWREKYQKKENNEKDGSSSSDEALKKVNAQMMERVEQLQYQLTKNKAQIAGLEKMCENYKIQIDQFNSGNSTVS